MSVAMLFVVSGLMDWPQFHLNAERTGRSPHYGFLSTTPTLKWAYATGGYVYGSAAVADLDGDSTVEVVFAGQGGNLYCVDGATGAFNWSDSIGNSWSSPAIADVDGDGAMDVLVQGASANLFCIDGATGALNWSYTIGPSSRCSPLVADVDGAPGLETVVFTASAVLAVRSDGTLLWSWPSGGTFDMGAAAADVDGDGTVEVCVVSGGTLYVLQGTDGAVERSMAVGGGNSTPSIADVDGDGTLDILVGGDSLNCFDGVTGVKKWAYYAPTFIYSAPPVGDLNGDGRLNAAFGSFNNSVIAVNADDGTLLWKYNTNDMAGDHSPVIADVDGDGVQDVLATNDYGRLLCLRGNTGALKWQWTFSGTNSGDVQPAVADVDADSCLEVLLGGWDNDMHVIDLPGNCSPVNVGSGERRPLESAGMTASTRGVELVLPAPAHAELAVYDLSGRRVLSLFNGQLDAGRHAFGLTGLREGVYVAVATLPGRTLVRPFALVR